MSPPPSPPGLIETALEHTGPEHCGVAAPLLFPELRPDLVPLELREEVIVVGVRTDPVLDDRISVAHTDGSIADADSR